VWGAIKDIGGRAVKTKAEDGTNVAIAKSGTTVGGMTDWVGMK